MIDIGRKMENVSILEIPAKSPLELTWNVKPVIIAEEEHIPREKIQKQYVLRDFASVISFTDVSDD